uniref:Uncharacterized protein n=1 Tax=Megaselia scalaris TaxID=36166 RepID=T1GY92_MEGSC
MAQRRPSTSHIISGNHENHITNSIETCQYCHPMQNFRTSSDFVKHLRDSHCTKEGGSYVCRYGSNGVCNCLPLEGVSEPDYEAHVAKYHVNVVSKEVPEEWSVYLAAQNLSAVLNDPIRGKQTNMFTKKWGDYFVEKVKIEKSPHLDNVEWGDFEVYLKRIGKRFKRHQRLAHLNYDPHTSEPNVV